ncbi:MAG: patatin-like phospholipase family protein [Planctomycetota bacterium]
MPRLGLALSGGGFRATLFHLGVIRFLKEADQLKNVTDIASVSGGSILAAHLALNWDRYTDSDKSFDEAAAEIVKFVKFDVRNHVVRRLPFQYPIRGLAKLTRREARGVTPDAVLESCYRKRLLGDRCLFELPEEPLLHILATNVSNGGLSVFNARGLYIQQRTKSETAEFQHVQTRMASIPRVVAASSAFPGLFPPVEITAADLGVREGEFPTEYFTDGGVYDNLGIRAFSWLKHQGNEFDQVIVSDAGKPFQILSEQSLGFIGQSVRASDILWDRVWQLERENFGKQKGFIFVPITATVDAEEQAVLHPVIQSEVQSIRTDLDSFSDAEINALAQHGYEVARKVYHTHVPPDQDSFVESTNKKPWAPIPEKRLPGCERGNSSRSEIAPAVLASRQLRRSSVRRVWSTMLNLRDWTSYVYIAIALMLFVYLPWTMHQLYERSVLLSMVNDAIAEGNPDISRVLNMVGNDPVVDWTPENVSEVPERTMIDYTGVEVMTHSRIIDLRNWDPEERDSDDRGRVYVSDRLELKLTKDYVGDRKVVIVFPSALDNLEFRQPTTTLPAEIRRVAGRVEEYGMERTFYEFVFDFDGISIGETVTIEMEMIADIPIVASRAHFETRMKTDLVSMWLLFPEDRPYQTYNLVQYPSDRGEAPEVLESRYKIHHPYGSLIGWSVVNPEVGNVYECRWTYE